MTNFTLNNTLSLKNITFAATYLLLSLLFVSGCTSSDRNNQVSIEPDKSSGTFILPTDIQQSKVDQSKILAWITIDDGQSTAQPQTMIIADGNAKFEKPDLMPGSYTFTIRFSYSDSTVELTDVTLATATKSTELTAGINTVEFSDSAYLYPDDDNDEFSNKVEIEAGTNPEDPNDKPSFPLYTIGGTITDLSGSGLVLQINDNETLNIATADNAFTFPTPLSNGSTYAVTISTQPNNPGQTCSVNNGNGTIDNANVDNISVSCITNASSPTPPNQPPNEPPNGIIDTPNTNITIVAGETVNFSATASDPDNNTPLSYQWDFGGGAMNVTEQDPGNVTFNTAGNYTVTFTVTDSLGLSDPTPAAMTVTVLAKYSVGGTVTGLSGSGLVLQINDAETLNLSANGTFSFPTPLVDGSSYAVIVATQPSNPNQSCSINNSNSNINGSPITNVLVTCMTTSYTVGGNVTGLVGSGLVLQLNGGNNLTISKNGDFTFDNKLTDGSTFTVSVLSQPSNPNQTCSVSNGNANISSAPITNILVTCTTTSYTIGGNVTGLVGSGLVLQLNGGNSLIINQNGGFNFNNKLIDGSTYSVSVSTQPNNPNQNCSVSNGSGTINGANVSNIAIQCLATLPTLTLDLGIKQLQFSWAAVQDTTYYRLLENHDGNSGFTQVGSDLSVSSTSTTVDIAVHKHDWANARYLLEACNAKGCTASNEVSTITTALDAIGYFKASNTDSGDGFGYSVGLSNDGHTLAVGATWASAVYIFTHKSGTWSQQAYIKASNTQKSDSFGVSLAISNDGNTLAVGASGEQSIATGIGGDQTDNTARGAGAVYVFTRRNESWSQQAYVKASNTQESDFFGASVAISSDGNTLAVGAFLEDSAAMGIDGDKEDNTAIDAGAVYVFTRRDGMWWSQQAYVKASNTARNDRFGWSLALRGDGNTLAVGAVSADGAGAVYIFTRNNNSWSQQAYVKASNTDWADRFGFSVALSDDGNTLAVGDSEEKSAARGIDGNQADNTARSAGAVYVFTHSNGTWSQQAYVKASNTNSFDWFGWSLALSNDGNTLAVGAYAENSAAKGIDGAQASNTAGGAGAVYVYSRSNGTWVQQVYVKASNTDGGDLFGRSLALSGDGGTLAVGANEEDSATTGISGDQKDNTAPSAGAVYLY